MPTTDDYGRRCLLARRMVEKGVRFVCVVSGGGTADTEWDAHSDIETNHIKMASYTDKPVAASDQGSEAPRACWIPPSCCGAASSAVRRNRRKSKGRDHHNTGFTMWVAGGGFKGGTVYGATDEIGLKAVEKPVHFRDLHATMLYQMGLDQDALSYMYLGRKERLTEVQGEV